jgi:predicted permease
MSDPVRIEDIISADGQHVDPDSQMDVIHVLRSAQAHHVSLSMIADQKANIVLGSYLVFLTVTQSLMKTNAELSLPIWVLTIGYTIAAVFALLVITPRFRDKSYRKGQVPGNLLFFGSFNNLSQEEYIDMLGKHLQSNEDARRLFMKDIYQIGQVLQKKYQSLRRSYLCLAAGIVAALIALTINSFLQ